MHWLDYVVLVAYFTGMAGIGVWAMRRVKRQEDYFLGGRTFGKLLQTFAAFGAGTGSSDPVNTARTTFTGGLSGMWSIMSWLFVTPFYWITGVWYRRMRHLTLGDWFVERYESKALGVAYTVFGLLFYIVYTAMLFTAIGKFAAPLIGTDVSFGSVSIGIEYVLVPVIAVVVIIYGVLGGLTAAYWTDLIQGSCIILLSILLIPFGLWALVQKYGDPANDGLVDGFRIMHEQVPDAMFTIVGSTAASDFPAYRIAAVAVILVVGVVVMPHFIATGGGSAKSENNARIGLVAGNFAKRFCTIGWAITALIVLAYMAGSKELAEDPDKVWGVASRELLRPGLVGLMLACLLAALMSSADCYMLVCSALVVRNIYAAYIDPDATEQKYVFLGRITGVGIIVGAVLVSWWMMDVFQQLQLTWLVPMLFAAPFWVGMWWRRATTAAAWTTLAYAAAVFFIIPPLAPAIVPDLRDNQDYAQVTDVVVTTTTRPASPADAARRSAAIELWDEQHQEALERLANAEKEASIDHSFPAKHEAVQRELKEARAAVDTFRPRPVPVAQGEDFTDTHTTGGKAIYWTDGVKPVNEQGEVLETVKPQPIGQPERIDEHTTRVVKRYTEGTTLQGFGKFRLDFLMYRWVGIDLTPASDAMLKTLELPLAIITPFLVMIVVSLVTPRNSKTALDRYYVKMKTPVDPDPEQDKRQMEQSYADPSRFDHKRLLPGTSLEFQRPTLVDALGFLIGFVICFAIVGLAILLAGIGG